MSALVIVCAVFLMLVAYQVAIYVWDRRDVQKRGEERADQYSIPDIDNVSIQEAGQNAHEILKRYGTARTNQLPIDIAGRLSAETEDILKNWEQLTFDRLTYQLNVSANAAELQTCFHPGVGEILQIGTWGSGEDVYVALSSANTKVYIYEGDESYQLLADSIYHYVMKAKQESDWADERLNE